MSGSAVFNFRVILPSLRSADLKLTGLMGSLRCSQLFSGLAAEDLSAIAAFTVPQTLAKGDYLFLSYFLGRASTMPDRKPIPHELLGREFPTPSNGPTPCEGPR